ncbi:MAG: DUF2764 family protein [Sedimentisphaerales bacterium]|nr:DUF2764 family protein [Sedimentisphaerales bacterium]
MAILNRYDYILSALPALEPIGSIPPISKIDFLNMITSSKGPVRTVGVILLSDDLMQYESFLSKEIDKDKIDLAVLSLENSEGEPVLPDFLLPEEEMREKTNERLAADDIWSRYFRYAALIAKHNSSFLKAWAGFEVGLRNALTTARAQMLGLEPDAYLVCPELADAETDYNNIISAWHAASNPMAALEVLDKARWDWLEEHAGLYSFSADEIEMYAAKLILLHHWRRILSGRQENNNIKETVY